MTPTARAALSSARTRAVRADVEEVDARAHSGRGHGQRGVQVGAADIDEQIDARRQGHEAAVVVDIDASAGRARADIRGHGRRRRVVPPRDHKG